MYPNIRVLTRQVAVGQGGLMFCCIQAETDSHALFQFHLGFDCGSVNREHLQQGLETVDGESLDILFISHLDADHVNGIDLLLDKTHVETVVLPCLDPLTVTAIVSVALNDGGTPVGFRTFLEDPVKWFAQRGVRRVLFLSRDRPVDGETVGPFTPPQDSPLKEGRIVERLDDDRRLPYAIQSMGNGPSSVRTPAGVVEVQILSAAAAIEVDLRASGIPALGLSWLLVPYVHPFPQRNINEFLVAVRKTLRVPDTVDLASARFRKHLLDALRNEDDRKELKRCYAHLSRDNNKPSMSLYSGPNAIEVGSIWSSAQTSERFHLRRRTPPSKSNSFVVLPTLPINHLFGWLTTGDADLSSTETRTAWLQRYKDLLGQIGVFVLPHHGSNASLHEEVIKRIGKVLTIACAATSRRYHPHPALMVRLRNHGLGVWQVSEEYESEFGMMVYA